MKVTERESEGGKGKRDRERQRSACLSSGACKKREGQKWEGDLHRASLLCLCTHGIGRHKATPSYHQHTTEKHGRMQNRK